MQTYPSQMSLVNSSPATQTINFLGNGSPPGDGFDSVLKGILGTANLNRHFAEIFNGDTQKTKIGMGLEIGKLNTVLQKLYAAFNAGNFQSSDMNRLEEIIESALSEEEISFLQDFLQKNIRQGADGGGLSDLIKENVQKAPGNNVAQTLDEIVLVLNGIIEKLATRSLPFLQPDNGQETQPQNISKDLLQLLSALKQKIGQMQNKQAAVSGNVAPDAKNNAVLGDKSALIQAQDGKSGRQQNLILNHHKTAQQQLAVKEKENSDQPDKISAALKNPQDKGILKILSSFSQKSFGLQQGDNKAFLSTARPLKQTLELLFGADEQLKSSLFESENVVKVAAGPEPHPILQHALLKHSQADKANRSGRMPRKIIMSEGTQQAALHESKAEMLSRVAAKAQVNPSSMLEQISNRISMGLRQGASRITLQLHPPSLGKLNIDLSMKNNQLQAVIIAESGQAKHVLDASLDQLRICLESHNIEVEKISVFVGHESRQYASLLRDQSGRGKKSMSPKDVSEVDGPEPNEEALAQLNMNLRGVGPETLDLFA